MHRLALIMLGALSVIAWGCSSKTSGDVHDEHDGHDHEQETTHGKEEDEEIVISPETAQSFGIEVDSVRLEPMTQSLRVSGRIEGSPSSTGVVTAPCAGIVTVAGGIIDGSHVSAGQTVATINSSAVAGANTTRQAKAALDAAVRELERVKPLHAEGIVSTRDYNAALAAVDAAKAALGVQTTSGRAVAPVSGTVTSLTVSTGQYVEAGSPIATVGSNERLTFRADVPERYFGQVQGFTDANVRMPGTDGNAISLSSLKGRRVAGDAVATSPGYLPVVFTFENDGSLRAGTVVEAWLTSVDPTAEKTLTVPVSALSEQQGNFFVYVRLDEHGYKKTRVETGANDGQTVAIMSGLKPADEIVVKGAAIVRMAETSGVVPEGHSHHH